MKILIANRGEIAIRTAKSIRELGHTPVGLWTDQEPASAALAFCDEWIHLEGNSLQETYLNMDKIIEAAKKEGIDALHPGYGLLSENAKFAKKLVKEGIIFIGPHPKAIELMGDKAKSKQWAKKHGVPVIPGSDGSVNDAQDALKIASKIGFPVLLKAVSGGGGRGMRACHSPKDIKEQFEAVGREAMASFGNGELLVEKLIVNPHHVEVQILGDKKGNIYHLFERECSIQRRHQKIIEEAPSPFIGEDEQLREELCQSAVLLAKSVEYDSAGTVEFIMGEDKKFYFLEMNTRIQVEHPITEEITGVDLVSCMIQAALGEKMDVRSQGDIGRMGHAIECRICAEDPTTLLPAPGIISGWEGDFSQGVRFDHGLYRGLQVKPDFDSLVGKLITKGNNRSVAIRKMQSALNKLAIEGLKTNIPLHNAIIKDPVFCKGNYSTDYIEQYAPQKKVSAAPNYSAICQSLAAYEMRQMER